MEIILLLISSGIPGLYTYYSLSVKNKIYFDNDSQKIILSFFSSISVVIFFLILALFSRINKINNLLEHILITNIIFALLVTAAIVIILTEFIYPIAYNLYNHYNNYYRENNKMSGIEDLPMHLIRYEDDRYTIYVVIKTMDDKIIDEGVIESYARKKNRNIIINKTYKEVKDMFENRSKKQETYIDFEHNVKLDYYFYDPSDEK